MTQIKGYRLYVNLGAAQTRRRLKGIGYGVRRVESAGKQRAAIVHTATGKNLEALRSLFADVLDRSADAASAEEPEHLGGIDDDDRIA
jgi:hypothetical protein